ncbi:hypothetical protein [Phenylobacterium sp.]|jgi:hypothetical protein|uniref:hypothetical protein n=1 Tax=Phenylobacterium sp. TaxID=1871053 RepID=UPI002F92B302
MIALLLAAQVAAAQPTLPAHTATIRVLPRTFTAPDPRNPFAVPEWCKSRVQRTARNVRSAPEKLGDLPRANLEYAVDRRVSGCPVPTPVHDRTGPIRSR